MTAKLRVLVIDDQIEYSYMVHQIIKSTPYMGRIDMGRRIRVDHAYMPQEADRLFRRGKSYDLIILDGYMHGEEGVDYLPALKKRFPDVPVLFWSTCMDEALSRAGMQNGASITLLKSSMPTEEQVEEYRTAVKKLLGIE